jgi:hypothetical protein
MATAIGETPVTCFGMFLLFDCIHIGLGFGPGIDVPGVADKAALFDFQFALMLGAGNDGLLKDEGTMVRGGRESHVRPDRANNPASYHCMEQYCCRTDERPEFHGGTSAFEFFEIHPVEFSWLELVEIQPVGNFMIGTEKYLLDLLPDSLVSLLAMRVLIFEPDHCCIPFIRKKPARQ